MGTNFTSLLLRKNGMNYKYTAHQLQHLLNRDGYVLVEQPEQAEFTLAIHQMEGQAWQLVSGDAAVLSRYAEAIAGKNKAESILVSCVDSDFVDYTLFAPDRKHKTTARSGFAYDESPNPVINSELWKAAAHSDVEMDVEAIFNKERTFAEDSLNELGNWLGFDGSAVINGCCGETEPNQILYFSKASGSLYAAEGEPRMELAGYQNVPVIPEQPCSISFVNRGGEGMGLQVMLYGPFVETEAMTFTDVVLRYDQEEYEGASMYKTKLTNGWYAYVYDFPTVKIVPGVRMDVFPSDAFYRAYGKSLWRLSAVPHGDSRYGLDVYYYVNPLQSPGKGFTHTNCGIDCHEEWIEEYNRHAEVLLKEADFQY
ncbi:MAG: hypothetical protein NC089_00660 [Bacteroides sp.]|nr:hypothetical protein [Bacteroides sp.]MCM1550602.1 hypothetical protein [Clostridium sp.]